MPATVKGTKKATEAALCLDAMFPSNPRIGLFASIEKGICIFLPGSLASDRFA